MIEDTSSPTEQPDRARRRIVERIRLARPADLSALATIHVSSGTPGLLSDLGCDFLERVYYRGILESHLAETYVLDLGQQPVGFVTLSRNSDRLFSEVMLRRWYLAALLIVRAGVRRPRVLRDLAETVLNVRRHRLDEGIEGDVVSLQIARRYQGLGFGLFLLERALARLREQGCSAIKARTLTSNTAVERLYLHCGFGDAGSFRLHGRAWRMQVWRAEPEMHKPTEGEDGS